VGVKELVEFSCRRGDLVHDGVAGPSAREGMLAHKKLQNEKAGTELAEVSLVGEFECLRETVKIQGRVDLIELEAAIPVVTEIKSSYVDPQHLPDSVRELQWAQLKIYGALLFTSDLNHPVASNQVRLRLSTFNLRDEQLYPEEVCFDRGQLQDFLSDALQRWTAWQLEVAALRAELQLSAADLDFPFDGYRSGQYELAASVFRCLRGGNKLLCEAPTGIGKTISSLFPACKALGEKHIDQVAYLTAKTSGREAAFAAIEQLKECGLKASTLVVQSKSLACHCQNGTCERDQNGRCPRTIGFFDRLPAARSSLLAGRDMGSSTIDAVASEYDICPFELSLQMLRWADIVICDYNYLFDPLVRLTVFAERENSIGFLIDEAHNLGDRARSMYSAQLSRQQNLAVTAVCKDSFPAVANVARALNRAIARIANAAEKADALPAAVEEVPTGLSRAVEKCLETLLGEDSSVSTAPDADNPVTESKGNWPEVVWQWFKELYRFRVIEQLYNEKHRTLIEREGTGKQQEVSVRLVCLDASDWLNTSFKRLHSAAVFSATLRPVDYQASVLGLADEGNTLTLPSPFSREQLACLVCDWIDTRYKHREYSAQELVDLIHRVCHSQQGNYLVFFPSYAYMQQIYRLYTMRHPEVETAIQEQGGGAQARDAFLSQFTPQTCTLGFAIMAGVFGEGIDYKGDSLIGAIVVGTGLPGLGLEQSLLQQQFIENGQNGFDYACRYPGLTRVLQAAGRVIRSERDKGIIVLVDPRFNSPFYRQLLPDFWEPKSCSTIAAVGDSLAEFWK